MAELLTARPEPLRSSCCNIQTALTSFGKGESWDGYGSLFLLLSFPLPCKAAPLFPSLDGVWMTGSEPSAGVPRRGPPRCATCPLGRTGAPLPPAADWLEASLHLRGWNRNVIPRALRAAPVAQINIRNYLYFLIKVLKTLCLLLRARIKILEGIPPSNLYLFQFRLPKESESI